MKPKYWGLVLLIAFGAAKMPLEDALTQSLREQKLQLPPPDLGWGENFVQLAASTLGGLRNLTASVAYIMSYNAFTDRDWGQVDTLMTLTTRLQPTEVSYWDEAAWNMTYNAASGYLRDKNRRFAEKHRLYRAHVQRGIKILEEGLRYNPDNPVLLQQLGDIYGGAQPKEPDPRLAAQYYMGAFEHGAKGQYERFAAYEMVKLGDEASWKKAYEILKRHYDTNPRCRTMASILRDLPVLEQRLNIPQEQRIHPPPPPVPKIPAKTKPGGVTPDAIPR